MSSTILKKYDVSNQETKVDILRKLDNLVYCKCMFYKLNKCKNKGKFEPYTVFGKTQNRVCSGCINNLLGKIADGPYDENNMDKHLKEHKDYLHPNLMMRIHFKNYSKEHYGYCEDYTRGSEEVSEQEYFQDYPLLYIFTNNDFNSFEKNILVKSEKMKFYPCYYNTKFLFEDDDNCCYSYKHVIKYEVVQRRVIHDFDLGS